MARSTVARRSVVSDILGQLRAACAEVAGRARHARIRQAAIPAYASELPGRPAPDDPSPGGDRELTAAFWLTLNAINFGSGWFPTLHKRPGSSGYHTVAAGLRERFERHGPWSAAELSVITPAQIAAVLGQEPGHELMALFARSLNDLGAHIAPAGGFAAVLEPAGDSAVSLVNTLAGWGCFADAARYGELELPFLKRAQIAAADLHRAGAARFEDLHRLTMFADNLVPHVLRLDGVLELDRNLVARIERGDLIAHGSREEVEIRACAVHAVELIVAVRPDLCPAEVDQLLWRRGQQPAYKAVPRHRCRCTAY